MTQKIDRSEALVSTAKHKYQGRWLKPGDPFLATATDADDLLALKFATRAPAKIHTADMTAESDAALAEPQRTKRAYHRRDMVAER